MMKNDNYIGIGQRLSEIRRSHRMKQDELAEKLGVSTKFISHVENGSNCYSISKLILFAQIFHCDMNYILLGKHGDSLGTKLPKGIVSILNSGTSEELDLLNKCLLLFLEMDKRI